MLEGCGHYSLLVLRAGLGPELMPLWIWAKRRPPNDQHQHHENEVPINSMVSNSKRSFPTKMTINWDLIIFRYTKNCYFSLGMFEFALKSAAEIAVVQWCVWSIWWCKTLVWHERWGWILCYVYIYIHTHMSMILFCKNWHMNLCIWSIYKYRCGTEESEDLGTVVWQ